VKYAELLMEQIDINGDGSVSIPELEAFLFPPHLTASDGPSGTDAREIGVVIDFTRTAVRYLVSSVAALGSDEAILAEFAKLAKTTLKRGMLDTRLVKKAFLNIKIPEFGRCLYKAEVDSLVASIDCNDDGVVSAHEFKHWLFPAHKKEDQESLAQYLKKIITNSFDGDLWAMYREFCNGSEQMYKADFVIVLKTLDSAISRHEALAMANKIAGTDKMITMAHLQAALGLSAGRTFLGGEGGSVANSESIDMDGYSLSQSQSQTFQSPRTKRRQRREQGSSGGKLPTHEEDAAGGVSLLGEEGVGGTPRTPKRSRAPRQGRERTPGGDLGTEQDATEGKR
jgi:Ca2+-binding EF-hand superfamily protein